MNKYRVYVTRMIPQPAIDLLHQSCEVEINPEDRVLTRQELLEKVKNRDAVISLLTDTIDEEILAAAGPQCKIFANYAVGFNNVDIPAATQKGILIANTPGILDNATADCAWALLFAASRRVVEADGFTRAGKYNGWGPMLLLGQEITGKTLGVIGAGRIGSNFAKKAKGFEMKVLYTDIEPNEEFERLTGGSYVDKDTLLREADFISIHIPLLPSTRHYIGEAQFRLMKRTAILINTARGPIVDEKALVKALQTGEIWGAGLDVFENEPAIEPALLGLSNVTLLPHVASATIDTRTNMGLIAAANVVQALRGELPVNCLNPEAYNKN